LAAVGSCAGGDPVGPTAGVPSALVSVGGDGQVAQISTQLVQDFVVRVDDVNGDPVASVPVSWAVTSGGGSITPTSDPTDAAGESHARLTLGSAAGVNTASATVSGIGSVTFTATGTTGGGGGAPPRVTSRSGLSTREAITLAPSPRPSWRIAGASTRMESWEPAPRR